MARSEAEDQFLTFLTSGIYRFDQTNVVFMDPVRVLNKSYSRFRVSSSAYYSRFFQSALCGTPENHDNDCKISKKRKRNNEVKKKPSFNWREQIADQRYQEVKPVLVAAHEALLEESQLLEVMRNLRNDGCVGVRAEEDLKRSELDFVELGANWRAPFFEITIHGCVDTDATSTGGESSNQKSFSLFESMVVNDGSDDAECDLLGHHYILPKRSCFFMSNIEKIRNLIPAESDCGFNLIIIDPPWENGSAHQKQKFQTLPCRYFLSLPIHQLTHKAGALVALWVTNREKLRSFVENELFPKWGVKHAATIYWLKVKADGSLIGELDLFHHRPYECLLLGFSSGEDISSEHLLRLNPIPDNQVCISIPGDYSRKPPIGELLQSYAPGSKPTRCIELFSREMLSGWTSWGNEPLHFQDSRYFLGGTTYR